MWRSLYVLRWEKVYARGVGLMQQLIAILFLFLVFGGLAVAEDEVVKRPVDEAYEEGWTKIRQFSKKEVSAACKKYEGKFIGYYDELYKVENCKRREVTRGKKLMKKQGNLKVHIVEPAIIAKLPQGKPLR